MANFFDKIGELAKSAADKTNELLEQNKLNSKINTEETAIAKLKEQIGNYYYEQFESGMTPEVAVNEWYLAIKTSEAKIAEVQAEILKMKEDEHAVPKTEKPQDEVVVSTAAVVCPTCSAENALGAKFCASCGAKL